MLVWTSLAPARNGVARGGFSIGALGRVGGGEGEGGGGDSGRLGANVGVGSNALRRLRLNLDDRFPKLPVELLFLQTSRLSKE